MTFMDRIFDRMNLSQISNFLLEGAENNNIENDTYVNRLNKGSEAIYKRLEDICQNEGELDNAAADLSEALLTYELVYMEIGMKFGARMMMNLLLTKDNIAFDNEK